MTNKQAQNWVRSHPITTLVGIIILITPAFLLLRPANHTWSLTSNHPQLINGRDDVTPISRPAANDGQIVIDQDSFSGLDYFKPAYEVVKTSTAGSGYQGKWLSFQLSSGQPVSQIASTPPADTGEPLSDQEIEQVLSRLPALRFEVQDQMDFRLPDDPVPPERAGTIIDQPFPPPPIPAGTAEVLSRPLEVLRHTPQGQISSISHINVTFDQPMVPLDTLEQVASVDIPLQLDPALPGTGEWLDAKTLSFELDMAEIGPLPMASVFTASIPAGTQSTLGGVLADTVSWTFNTPPPRLTSYHPRSNNQMLDLVFVLGFDQRIDPPAVLTTVRVRAGERAYPIRSATDAELAKDPAAQQTFNNIHQHRRLAFVTEELLPADTAIQVTVGPGTPSAEGPLVTQQAQSYEFRTYEPLKLTSHSCAGPYNQCRPLEPIYIRFNNPIDVEAYRESMLRVQPALSQATVQIESTNLIIRGETKDNTTYRVTVSADIQDVYGQTLDQDEHFSFEIKAPEPRQSSLIQAPQSFLTLDPSLPNPTLAILALNHDRLKVQAYHVQPADWPAYQEYLDFYHRDDLPPTPPGRRVMNQTIRVQAAENTLTQVDIDLSSALDGDMGHLLVRVEPAGIRPDKIHRNQQTAHVWVQMTQIGLDAFTDSHEVVVWTTALQDGSPLAGVSIEDSDKNQLALTNHTGTARFPLSAQGRGLLIARQGDDTAFLTHINRPNSRPNQLLWYVFDDRAMYRPGEEVHLKGWLRKLEWGENGDVVLPSDELQNIYYRVVGARGNELATGQMHVNAWGGFDLALNLPDNANLGLATVQLSTQGNLGNFNYSHQFQIQEFRRPEFEVTIRSDDLGSLMVGDQATLAVQANYYSGGPLPNAPVAWQVSSTPTAYAPPNWPNFVFGSWFPWWYGEQPAYGDQPGWSSASASYSADLNGQTDAAGTHLLQINLEEANATCPFSVLAKASVTDANRQLWASSTSFVVHPAQLYVGLRSERTFVEQGDPLEVQVIVTDIDGNPVADRPVQVHARQSEWKRQQGQWHKSETEQICNVGSGVEPVTCRFETSQGGQYVITASVTDQAGRHNQSQFTRWVSGDQRPTAGKVAQESVTLIPDQEHYRPGDTAQILVQSPFACPASSTCPPVEGLLTVARSGLLYTDTFRMDGPNTTLELPVEEAYIPNFYLQVDLVSAVPRLDNGGQALDDLPLRPAFATGRVNLSVPPRVRELSVQLNPAETELEPGGSTTVEVLVTDRQNQPVADAELAVVVVDEAVLALTKYQLDDPISVFYSHLRPADISSVYGRKSIVLADPAALAQQIMEQQAREAEPEHEAEPVEVTESARGGFEASKISIDESQPIRLRSDFNPLASFAPNVTTDERGRASVAITLPDNLSRYRVMAVAVAGDHQFGSAESAITARLPLMVRPSPPRFLNFGDHFELPVLVQNLTDEPMEVNVLVQASNLKLDDYAGRRVSIPAHGRVELRFPASADRPGTARFQVAVVSGDYADAAELELPVYTPATTEAFAVYGVIDEGAIAQPVASMTGVYSQTGGLEISTSSTALQALTDAVLYLYSYPYECSEQLASRILSVSALRQVLTAFRARGLPSASAMEAAVQRDIQRLENLQNPDGGFPTWTRGHESIPINTIHVAHALQWAKSKDFEVPQQMQASVLEYLRYIEGFYPEWYQPRTRQTLSAYALYVRDLMGDSDAAKARQLLDEAGLDELSLEALAWLWQVLLDDPNSASQRESIEHHINNRAMETAGAANFTTSYGEQAYLLLHSARRTDAIILDALIAADPQSDLIPKIVNGLLAHRTRGRWSNTQENIFVLLALDRYFNTFEAQTPDFEARIWLGQTFVGQHQYLGRTTEQRRTEVPIAYLVQSQEAQNLVLSKEGDGRLYYRLGLEYAPADLHLDPLDRGFIVERSYHAIDDPEDVYQDEEGVWHIRAGAQVRVEIRMVAENRRYHVALIDSLPAGLEIVNPSLAVSQDMPQNPHSSAYHTWRGSWYRHQNLRDERAEAFTPLLWEGVYHYAYIARATIPGNFIVPPAKAEEMYAPEVFGRSGSDLVMVE